MKSFDHLFHDFCIKPFLRLYLRFDRRVSYDGFRVLIKKGVFHPLLFFSTKFLYSFLQTQDLNHKKFLEIGSGSGLLSMLAYRKGATVTAVDIDPRAVESTLHNFKNNFDTSSATVVISDVFEKVPLQKYDMVVINPPYYFKAVSHPNHQAWYCGENGEYFKKLFFGLKQFMHPGLCAYMILEENCELARINCLAEEHGLTMVIVTEKKIRWEKSTIYEIRAVE